jgi:hypothetical protein
VLHDCGVSFRLLCCTEKKPTRATARGPRGASNPLKIRPSRGAIRNKPHRMRPVSAGPATVRRQLAPVGHALPYPLPPTRRFPRRDPLDRRQEPISGPRVSTCSPRAARRAPGANRPRNVPWSSTSPPPARPNFHPFGTRNREGSDQIKTQRPRS